VTINQTRNFLGRDDQADPTSTSPIHFTAVFGEPVTGFTDSDVSLSGTAGATTADVTGICNSHAGLCDTEEDDTIYDVAVSGMTSDGTVIASIPANVAKDFALHSNTASTSTDNTVTFEAPNSAPTAVGNSYTTNEDTTLTADGAGTNPAGVLSNDTDPDSGDTLTAVLVTGPSHGTLSLNADGSFTYTPNNTYTGPDSFTYQASDSSAASNVATVNITVNAVTPVAVDIKPATCPNPLRTPASGTIPVAILGTSSFDVSKVDPASVTLEGVKAQQGRSSATINDVATPYSGTIPEPPLADGGQFKCTTAGPDGQNDLNLKFDAKRVISALGTITDKKTLRVLKLTGELKDGTPIEGKDVVIINKKK
jgi:VCBS repeat-containing protein